MHKFSLIISLCLGLPTVHAQGIIVGNVKWNSSGKALTEKEIVSNYRFGFERKGGAFSFFQSGTLKSTGEQIGMKLEDPNSKLCFLPQEVQVYEDLQKRAENLLDKGFANFYGYGYYNKKRVQIMSKFGLDLADNADEKSIYFYGWDDLRFIATSAIDRIRFLHDTGYIHNDIKPDNFMYGLEDPHKVDPKNNGRVSLKNRVYMIDFGGAIRYRDANGTHYKQSAVAPYAVTTDPYCSRTYHKKLMRSRRDDMETLGYTLLMCGGVEVPWNDYPQNNTKKIIEEQNRLCEKLEVVSICRQSEVIDKKIQAAFSTYFFLLKNLFTAEDGFSREPDYDGFKKCFSEDPQGHYLNLTGKEFDETVFQLMRRVAKKFSSSNKPKQKT